MNQFQFQAQCEQINYQYDEDSSPNLLIMHQTKVQKKLSYGSSTAEQCDSSDNSEPIKSEGEEKVPELNPDEYIYNMNLRYYPTFCQEEFIHNFLPHETISKIKLRMCYEIVDDPETLKFEQWVENLHQQTGPKLARELKVKKYLEKKHSRTYEKKVHYLMRQKVAGERIRIKGRFITWRQAVKLLDKDDQQKEWTYNDYFRIKHLLYQKFKIST